MFILKIEKENIEYIGIPKTPIDFVIVGIILCLGSEIIEKKFENYFEEIKVCFSNKKIKIICKCEEKEKIKFNEVYNSCFILKNLTIDKEVIFINTK